VGDVL